HWHAPLPLHRPLPLHVVFAEHVAEQFDPYESSSHTLHPGPVKLPVQLTGAASVFTSHRGPV
ncbi:MAG: hypothetical protein ACPIOQ_20825, partial [Promethearchaeia archaeon]